MKQFVEKHFVTVRERYLLRNYILAVIYVVGEFGASYLIRVVGIPRALAFVVALLPAFAMAGVFYNNLRMITEIKDEFMRMLMVRQQLIAAGFAMAGAMIWGTLQMFLLVRPFEAVFVVVLWAVGLLVGALTNRITYGVWGSCL